MLVHTTAHLMYLFMLLTCRWPRADSHAICRPALCNVQPFPSDYNAAVRQAQAAVQAALADGATLIEVEFPTASLAAVAGDAEGAWPMLCCCCCAEGRQHICCRAAA